MRWGRKVFWSFQRVLLERRHFLQGTGGVIVSFALRILFSVLYRLVWQIWDSVYRLGIVRTYSLPVPVISVGNLEMGGTGKTPMVRVLAEALAREGIKPAILSRGYGRESRGMIVVSGEEGTGTDYSNSGDEPALLAHWVSTLPVLVGKDRYQAALEGLRRFSPQVFLLDDGFSYRRLFKDVEIVMMPARQRNSSFPLGCWREPFSQLKRADVVVIVGDSVDPQLIRSVVRVNPGLVVFRAQYQLKGCREIAFRKRWKNGEVGRRYFLERETFAAGLYPLEAFHGEKVLAVAGIANPPAFFELVKRAGMEVVKEWAFPDHYPYSLRDLLRIEELAQRNGVDVVLTTEKDGVRWRKFLGDRVSEAVKWYEVVGELKVEREEQFLRLVGSRLTGKIPSIFLDLGMIIDVNQECLSGPPRLELVPGVVEAIQKINASPYLAVLVGDYSGTGWDFLRESQLHLVQIRLEELLARFGAWLDAYYFCSSGGDRRGEGQGLLGLIQRAVAEWGIDLAGSYFIGIQRGGIQSARQMGMQVVRVELRGAIRQESDYNGGNSFSLVAFRAGSLSEAVEEILYSGSISKEARL